MGEEVVMELRRRAFLSALAAPVISPVNGATKMMKPKVLKKGDTVGFVTPSTYVSSPDEIASALRTADYFGLKVKMGPNVRKRTGYVGGTIAERAADLIRGRPVLAPAYDAAWAAG